VTVPVPGFGRGLSGLLSLEGRSSTSQDPTPPKTPHIPTCVSGSQHAQHSPSHPLASHDAWVARHLHLACTCDLLDELARSEAELMKASSLVRSSVDKFSTNVLYAVISSVIYAPLTSTTSLVVSIMGSSDSGWEQDTIMTSRTRP